MNKRGRRAGASEPSIYDATSSRAEPQAPTEYEPPSIVASQLVAVPSVLKFVHSLTCRIARSCAVTSASAGPGDFVQCPTRLVHELRRRVRPPWRGLAVFNECGREILPIPQR
jgi:hypothetical protein